MNYNWHTLLMAVGQPGFNWYGFLIASGMIISIVVCYNLAKRRGYYKDMVFDIACICIPLAIIGARAYFVIFYKIDHPGSYSTFGSLFQTWNGGLAIYGGLIGATIGGIILHFIYKNKPKDKSATFFQMADMAFTLIILAQAIGRWGNFINNEAYGNIVSNPSWQWFPYAVHIGSSWYQATFFYESMWNVLGFGLLLYLYIGKRRSFDGFSTGVYCIWYGFGRFFIEALRSDSLWLIPQVIRVSQVVSVLIFLFGLCFILYHVYKAMQAGLKPYILVPEDNLNKSFYAYKGSSVYYARKIKKLKEEDRLRRRNETNEEDSYDPTIDKEIPFEQIKMNNAEEDGELEKELYEDMNSNYEEIEENGSTDDK